MEVLNINLKLLWFALVWKTIYIMNTFTTNLGEVLRISANHSKRTFTIRTDVAKYRTIRLSKEEFNSCLNNTVQDWKFFLRKGDDYYKVR